jgi:hypothetical protein
MLAEIRHSLAKLLARDEAHAPLAANIAKLPELLSPNGRRGPAHGRQHRQAVGVAACFRGCAEAKVIAKHLLLSIKKQRFLQFEVIIKYSM